MTTEEQKQEIKALFKSAFPRECFKYFDTTKQIPDFDTFRDACHKISKLRKRGGHLRFCHLALRHKDGTILHYVIDKPPYEYEDFERSCNDYLKMHQDFFADNAPLSDELRMKDGDKYRVLIGFTDKWTTTLMYYTTELEYLNDYSDRDWYPDYPEDLLLADGQNIEDTEYEYET